MSLFKRGNTWWYSIYPPGGGERVRGTTGTTVKSKAQEFHDRLVAELWEQSKLKKKPDRKWQEAVIKYLKEKENDISESSLVNIKLHLKHCNAILGEMCLREISKGTIAELKELRKQDDVSNSTVNRMLEVVRAVMNKACSSWEWIERVPEFEMLSEPKKRIRWISHNEAENLLRELPEHLKVMADFSLQTGLRKSNVTGLKWSQVDLSRQHAWIYADEIKNNEDLSIPLNERAMELIRNQIGKNQIYVFTYLGNPVIQTNTVAWRKALKRAKIKNFRWHDLRHTWASWHIQNGTPKSILQELGGWSGPELVDLYAHLSSTHLRPFVENISLGNVINFQKRKKKK